MSAATADFSKKAKNNLGYQVKEAPFPKASTVN